MDRCPNECDRGWTRSYAMAELRPLRGVSSRAIAINNSGQAVGAAQTPTGEWRAVLWDAGVTVDLGSLPGRTGSHAWDINDLGWVVGVSSGEPRRGDCAVLWVDACARELPAPGHLHGPAFAAALNNRGQIVGAAFTDAEPSSSDHHAVLWHNSLASDLGTLPGGSQSHAWDITDAGDIVSLADTADGSDRACLWPEDAVEQLGTLTGADSGARAIDSRREVEGGARTSGGYVHAFVWQAGAMCDLGTLPGHTHSRAYDINDDGDVVGVATVALPGRLGRRAVLWADGGARDLNQLVHDIGDWRLTRAHGINNHGQIVGERVIRGGERAFMLTPVQ
jgi:probable HAF family extracellular repeat protein